LRVICSNCGTENRVGAKFCVGCATRLSVVCPTCGLANVPTARFCEECATPLSDAGPVRATAPVPAPGSAPAPAADALAAATATAERRLVSILFADLVGFTPFAEERDAEEVRDTLSRYFELASDVVGRYGGTVEKFIGDAVMAVWGAPTAQEDDAERAVRAALELVDGVGQLGPRIQARAGVLTGEAAVTIGALNQGMVAGDLVNTASRLQSVAPAGSVLVGESTFRAASKAIAFEEAGDQALKGKAAPVPAWRALRVIAQRGGYGRSDLPEPPFVGRADELRTLRDAVTSTGRDRRPRLVSITGPGGIGKSRLAWELEKYIDGVTEVIYWHRGRSPAYGDGITFWALGEMVRRRAGLAESDDAATTRARLAATVAEYVPEDVDRRWVEPALLTLLGLEPSPPGGRDVLFAAWRIFFERIAAQGTTILLFEDLQWADGGLLDFIDHLLDWSKGVPILIVTLARPELFDRRPDWGAARRAYSAMALEPLSETAMRELLEGFVPGLPAAAVDAILRRADGIPLYAVETVRALVADGKLVVADGVYRPAGELGDLAVPETLRSLIASRLDALEPLDRDLVQDASVLGQTFSRAALAAIAGRPEDELESHLRALGRREILELEADPRSPERGQYRFVQSLIREVAYTTLGRRERRARHLAAARYFESLGDEELAGALAAHYVAALETSTQGAEADAAAIQARLALRGAADRAATLGAHDQAVVYLRQAIAITSDLSEQAELEVRAARSAATAGDYSDSSALGRSAIADFERAGDRAGATRATAELGSLELHGGDVEEAHGMLEAAVRDLPPDTPDDVRAPLLANLSRALMRLGREEGSIAYADEALTLAEPLDLTEVIADALNNKASSLSRLGRKREATALLESAIEIAHDGGFVSAELRARSNLASGLFLTEPVMALSTQLTNFELAMRVGNRTMALWIAAQAVAAGWLTGRDWDRSLAVAESALAEARSIVDQARIQSARCLILVARGEATDSELRMLDDAARVSTDIEAQMDPFYLRGDRAMVRGEYDEAYRMFIAGAEKDPLPNVLLGEALRAALLMRERQRLLDVLERLDALPIATVRMIATDRLFGRAGLAALEGQTDDAVAGFVDAWRRYRDMQADFLLARAIIDGLMVVGATSEPFRAAAAEARSIFARVGARPYLELLDRVVASGKGDGAAGSGPAAGAAAPDTSESARVAT
jgi:class 3 adenylate cyclase/predicted ATPase